VAISKRIASSLAGASFIRKMFEEGERLRKIYGPDKVYDFSLATQAVNRRLYKGKAQTACPGAHSRHASLYEQRRFIGYS
jgi:hypothetical protein